MARESAGRCTRVLGALTAVGLLAATGALAHAQQPPVQTASDVKGDGALTVAGAVDAARRLDRQRAATERALFSSDETLPVTLIADFKAVNRDRNPSSTKVFPATLVAPRPGGGEDRMVVNIRTRGHARRAATTCTFAPLRIEFPAKADGTIFEGHKSLKLGTHCRDVDTYEQYVYREYAVYKLFNQVTPRSFRVRLAKATYVDAASNKPITTRGGLFLEDDDDVARRLGGETSELQGLAFSHVDRESMATLGLFEYMIGNTDVSLFKLHNIIVVRAANGVMYPVPYDFDYSGVVEARYAIPSAALNLSTVRERLYRGPCIKQDELAPLLARLRGLRDDLLGLYDNVPSLDEGYRKGAKNYLDGFFKILEKPGDTKKAFIEGCNRKTM